MLARITVWPTVAAADPTRNVPVPGTLLISTAVNASSSASSKGKSASLNTYGLSAVALMDTMTVAMPASGLD